MLVDIRHEPSLNDKNMYDWIVYHGFMPVIIATKLDKIKRSQVAKHIKMIKESLGATSGNKNIPLLVINETGER